MGKDHDPSDFSRPSGYKSDLENAETGSLVKSINTSFGSRNHNAYIMRSDGTHEHFYYDPQTQKSGWHGYRYATKNNHPDKNADLKSEGGKKMDRNSFIQSIKASKATINQCNQVSKNWSQNQATQSGKNGKDNGGKERGDSNNAPMSHGREGGNKGGPPATHSTSNGGHTANGQSTASGHSSSGVSSGGGHSSGGQGTSGQGSGGHGSGGHGSGGH